MTEYATLADLASIIPAAALASIDDATKTAVLLRASVECDGYLECQYKLPLQSWSVDLTQTVCQIAAYRLMMLRGFNPDSSHDQHFRLLYDDAVTWLTKMARGVISPPGLIDSAPSGAHVGGPHVVTGQQGNLISSGIARNTGAGGRGW